MKNVWLLLSISIFLFSCGSEGDYSLDNSEGKEQIGKGGSTTKFAIVGDFLYIVEHSTLKTLNISDPTNPEVIDEIVVSDELETIFVYEQVGEDTVLLLGAQNGMHVFKIRSDGTPNNGDAIILAHQTSCDPVVANNGYAYVTLRSSETWGCSEGFNELHVMDISTIESPIKVGQSIKMEGPKGLSFSQDGNALLVCDKNSLKIYSLIDPVYPNEENEYRNIQCNDILQFEEHYILTGDSLLKVYSFDELLYEIKEEVDLLN
ncbi:MAG: hypothetical protein HRU38_02490 [Saccharospirillaceae bacterium]|nr:hypothetical protein [Pseudomonadales bacterium]NRB77529.1 hypothetical protein [Saccharospirillaceae bacterium]